MSSSPISQHPPLRVPRHATVVAVPLLGPNSHLSPDRSQKRFGNVETTEDWCTVVEC